MTSLNSKDSRSSVFDEKLMEGFDHILAEKDVTFENVSPFDWEIVEELLQEKLRRSPPASPEPTEITEPLVNLDVWMGSGNHEDAQTSVSKKELVGEFKWSLADTEQLSERLAPSEWVIVEHLLIGKISTLPPLIMPAPPQITNDSDVRMCSVNDKTSDSTTSMTKFLEEFDLTFTEDLKNNFPTEFQKVQDLLSPPPPNLPPANVISVSPQFNMDETVVNQNEDHNSIFWPACPPWNPQAPSNPIRPSVIMGPSQSRVGINSLSEQDSRSSVFMEEVIEDVGCLPPEKRAKSANAAPASFMMEEFPLEDVHVSPLPSLTHSPPPVLLERQAGVQGPPPYFAHGAPSLVLPSMAQLNSYPASLPTGAAYCQGEILQSLPIANLPRNAVLQPFGVLNGQVLYSIASPPPLSDASGSKKRKRKNDMEDARPYVKKPPNAFMLFLKEQRPRVLNITNSAGVNGILGERWNSLPEDEKAKYYELARVERQQHDHHHPEWSTYDNYGKKRKRARQNTSESSSPANTPKGLLQFLA